MSVSVLIRAALPEDFVQRVNAITDQMDANRTIIDAIWAKKTYSDADGDKACALLDANAELEEQLLGLLLCAGLQPEKIRKALS